MGWKDRLGYWWKQLDRGQAKTELNEEMRLHLEMEIQSNLDAGMTPREARRRALGKFGNAERYKEECYDESGMRPLDGWVRDISYAFRMLRKRPLLTILSATILALGIGPATAVFSVVHGVVLKPLPFTAPEALVTISAANDGRGWNGFPIPEGAFQAFREESRTLLQMEAYQEGAYTWVGGPEPERLKGVEVTPDFFQLLGVAPPVGRTFGAPGERSREVIISHGLWQRSFGGDRSIVGRTMRLEGELHTIIGVLPPEFAYPERETQVWLPLSLGNNDRPWGRWSLRAIARRSPQAALDTAQQEVTAMTEGFAENLPFGGGWRFSVTTLEDELFSEVRSGLWSLLGSVGLVVLIASLNVAAICLARLRERRSELEMRSVLGAGRWTLVRQLLVEHLLLAFLGATGGVFLAHVLLGAILALSPADLPRLEMVAIDPSVLLFALLVTLLSGLLTAGLPLLTLSKLPASPLIRGGLRGLIRTPRASRSRQLLVGAQVAGVTILLVVAGLMVRSFLQVTGVDVGVRTSNVLAVSVELSGDRYPESHQWASFFEQLLEGAATLPGTRSIGMTTGLPTRGVQSVDSSFQTENSDEPLPLQVAMDSVSPGYFEASGIPLLKGRTFLASDGSNDPAVAIINQKLAEAAFPGQDPVGVRVLASDDETWLTVVGVSGNVKQYGLDRDTPMQLYRPFSQQPSSRAHLLLAVDQASPGLAALARQIVHGVDPQQPVQSARWMNEVVAESVAPRRFPAILLSTFALLALLLALAGIYGMLAHLVSVRNHELGVRMALGAQKGDLLRLILVPAVRLTLAGVVVGLAVALMVTGYLENQLFGVQPLDPASFLLVALSVPLVALLAGYLPARRAATTDPVGALRHD